MPPPVRRKLLAFTWVILVLTALVVGLGVWAFQRQQIDAYPDISGQMVQVITYNNGPSLAGRRWLRVVVAYSAAFNS